MRRQPFGFEMFCVGIFGWLPAILLGPLLMFAWPMTAVGADVLDTKPLPGVVLDDTEAEQTGPWQESVFSKPYVGKGYVHSGKPDEAISKVPKSLTFRPKALKPGKYAVLLAYHTGPNRAAQAPVVVRHAGGEKKLTINQRETSNGPTLFHLLGRFEFAADQEAAITISDHNAEGIVVVDALLLVPESELVKLDAAAAEIAAAANATKANQKKQAEPAAPAVPPFIRTKSPDWKTLTPEELDQRISEEAHLTETADLVDDEAFLRRVTLDVVGRIPTEEERERFLTETHPAKRPLLVDRLLESPEFGQNWATYWSDVFSYRIPQPELTFLDYEVFQAWMTQQLNEGTGWDEISYRILTATGKVEDNPPAFFIGFHQASTSRLAGETTRIFLGTQIQCAECHHHPFLDIPQERFHQMAAFFVRTSAKLPWNDSSQIVVSSKKAGEHKLPETNRVMLPTVFEGEQLAKGASDIDRRVELARWVTDPENRLLAKAYVNRMWERLMDQPFCDPVDEISSEAGFPSLPGVHDAVAEHFAAHQFDAKSLFRLILNTDAYQRKLDVDDSLVGQLTSAKPRKMRGDVVFKSLATATGLPNVEGEPTEPTSAMRFPPPPKSTLDRVNEVFGYDPSLGKPFRPQTMQQAMFLMNNRQLQSQIQAGDEQETKLARLLRDSPDDREAIRRLYIHVLARAPREQELATAYKFVQEIESREDAFEDLLWALLNTAEFTTRH